jgi:hypothetical protein
MNDLELLDFLSSVGVPKLPKVDIYFDFGLPIPENTSSEELLLDVDSDVDFNGELNEVYTLDVDDGATQAVLLLTEKLA